MTEQQLLGAYAFGVPTAHAILKATPADFQVEEQLDLDLTGTGEHLWLWIEKQGLNTEEVASRLSKAAHIPLRAISYAGLKDRQAITRQWFSLHLPGKADPDLSPLAGDGISVLRTTRHNRKLQRGAHKGNRFVICLTELTGDIEQLKQRIEQVAAQGVPNYYGLQRFGREGFNVLKAQEFAQQNILPEKRNVRSRLLSSARSYLFNQVLNQRVKEQTWNQILAGDLVGFTGSKSFFPASELAADDPRLALLDIHPTAMLWGEGELPCGAQTHKLEQQVAEQNLALCQWLEHAQLKQERRITRLPVSQLHAAFSGQQVVLSFSLPVGCFATVVLRELFVLETIHEGAQCAY